MTASLLDAALYYAELGYPVFPCRPGEKQPLTQHGFLDATTDPAQIQAWWSRWPEANVAISTSGLLVIDVDIQAAGWPSDPERAAQLAEAGAISLTPRGGRHYLFRRPPGKTWRCSVGRLAPGIDIRTDGGYILVPPSQTGKRLYGWVPGLELNKPVEGLPEPPTWLVTLLDVPETSSPFSNTDGFSIPEGQRNNALTRLAGTMRRAGMTKAEILAALRQVNTDRCRPPLPPAEVERIAQSVARYEPNQAATILVHGLEAQLSSGPNGIRFVGISSAELAAAQYTLEYLVDNILVRGQPGIMAGPRKTLKTSLLIDLALSLAEGGLFVGRFKVLTPVRVGIMSGESGAATIQETALRIAAAKGRSLTEYENVIWCFEVPQLGHTLHMAALEDFIVEHRLDVLILDPTYLMMLGLGEGASNLFIVGRFLKSLSALTQNTGCTPLLCHHLRKTRVEPYEPPELDDIAWAGFQEFVRQWILVGRRKKYLPVDEGYHRLWLNIGGSAGHGGLWGLDVDEGTRQQPTGRRWEVTVLTAQEVYLADQESQRRRKHSTWQGF